MNFEYIQDTTRKFVSKKLNHRTPYILTKDVYHYSCYDSIFINRCGFSFLKKTIRNKKQLGRILQKDFHNDYDSIMNLLSNNTLRYKYLCQSRNKKQISTNILEPRIGFDILFRKTAVFNDGEQRNMNIGRKSFAIFVHLDNAVSPSKIMIRGCFGSLCMSLGIDRKVDLEVKKNVEYIKSEIGKGNYYNSCSRIMKASNIAIKKWSFSGV